MCAACLRSVEGALWCEPCSRRIEAAPPSGFARAALTIVRVGFALLMGSWIGMYFVAPALVLGVFAAIPVGVAGGGLALADLLMQKDGSSPSSGRPLVSSALLGAAFLIVAGGLVSFFSTFL